MLRCQPGDLAIIIAAPFKERIGVLCTVIEIDTRDEETVDPRPHWKVQTVIPVPWYFSDDPDRKVAVIDVKGSIADADLQPIRGNDLAKQIEIGKKIKVPELIP